MVRNEWRSLLSFIEISLLLQVATSRVFARGPTPEDWDKADRVASYPDSKGMLGRAQNSAPSYLLGPGWPGEKSRVLADGGQLYPLIIRPHDELETHGFL